MRRILALARGQLGGERGRIGGAQLAVLDDRLAADEQRVDRPRRAERERRDRVGDAGEARARRGPTARRRPARRRVRWPELVVAAEAAGAVAGGELEHLARGQRGRAAARRARGRAPRAARRRSSPHSFEAAPSTPSPTGAPAASSAGTGAMPAPSRPFDVGQCATPVPVAPIRCASAPSRWTQCASQTSSPSQPRSSTYCSGRTPKRSRQNVLLVGRSRRGACAGARRGRGPARRSRAISSRLTENGEVGASAIRTIAPGSGSWKRSIAAALAARIASRSSTSVVGRQAAVARAEVHRAAARVEAQPDRARRLDLDREQVAGVAREDVVVVGRGRAARARERGEAGAGRGVDDRGVDPLPHRVERDEPLEQRRLLRVAARGVLVEVVVAVDEPGRGELAAPVDPPRAVRARPGAGPGPTAAIRAALADDVAVRELAPLGVHGRDRAALDDGDARVQSGGIYSLRRSTGIDMDTVDRLDHDAFVARFGGVFEQSPWVAERAWAARPFGSFDALHARWSTPWRARRARCGSR